MSTDSSQPGVSEKAHAIAAQLREAQRIAGIGSWEWQITTGLVTWSEGLHLILARDPQLGEPAYTMLSQIGRAHV